MNNTDNTDREHIPNAANELRLIAAEIIYKLWQAGETTQLELLMSQVKRSLERPYVPMEDPTS